MNEQPLHVLLVEDDSEEARSLKERLAESELGAFRVAAVERLAEAKDVLGKARVDVVLLDLSLPDSTGVETFVALRACCAKTPIIVLVGPDDLARGAETVGMGAQDYLTKGQIGAQLLAKSIHYAIERQHLLVELETLRRREQDVVKLSLFDEDTGLYNRLGFCNIAEHQLKLAVRDGVGVYLLHVGLDNFKATNDVFGQAKSDGLLTACARALKHCFRTSDVLGRMGIDEFAVLAIHVDANRLDSLSRRLTRVIDAENQARRVPPLLALSVGAAHYSPLHPCELNELLTQAETRMRAEQRNKKEK